MYTNRYVRADRIYDNFDGVREDAEIQGISDSADCQMFDDGSGYAFYVYLSERLRDMIEDRFSEIFI